MNEQLAYDSYLTGDAVGDAKRYAASGEFAEIVRLFGDQPRGGVVLDVGAGTGISSYALAVSGASHVYALKPDPSLEAGRAAIEAVRDGLPITILDSRGEEIPLDDETVDLAHVRQTLHHADDLFGLVSECARVLRAGGLFLALREHVVDDEEQLREFLAGHPIHRYTGGENAYSLSTYTEAIEAAGLRLTRTIGPWDSIVNAFPTVTSEEERLAYPVKLLTARFGSLGRFAALVPGAKALVWRRLRAKRPAGRLYSFVARK